MLSFREYLNRGQQPQQSAPSAQLRTVSQPKQSLNFLEKGVSAVSNFLGGFAQPKQIIGKTLGGIGTQITPTIKKVFDSGLVGVNGATGPSLQQNIASIAQKFPDTTVKVNETKKQGFGKYEASLGPIKVPVSEMGAKALPFISSMPGEIIRSYGRTADRDALPKTIEGARKLPEQVAQAVKDPKKGLEILNNPAVENALNASDVFTLGAGTVIKSGLRKGLTRTAGKELVEEGAEKGIREGVEKAIKAVPSLDKIDIQEGLKAITRFDDLRGNAKYVAGQGIEDERFIRELASDYIDPKFATEAPTENVAQELLNAIRVEQKKPTVTLSPDTSIVENKRVIKPLPQSPLEKVIAALNEAKPLQKGQEAAYREARGRRILQAQQAVENAGGGREGAIARLSSFKGELAPKAQFEGIESSLEAGDIDALHNMINENKVITEFEKIPASKGLEKLFKGQVPVKNELKLLDEVFGTDFTNAALSNLSTMQKIGNMAADVLNVPRSIMSSTDLSAPLRQGVVMAPSHPKDFLRSFKNMFGYTFSQKKFDNFYKELPKRPNYPKMRDSGLDITNVGPISAREEAFQSNLAEKIPFLGSLVKASGRGYTGFLNNFRADLFDTLYKNGVKLGKGDDPVYLRSLANFINTATGRGELRNIPGIGKQLEASAPILNASFFSPRLIASRISFFNPAYYARMEPTVRKEAAKSIVAFVGSGMTILGLAALAGAEVETDPTSADFGKIKVGNTRYDIWGGFQPYATFIARMLLGRQKSTTTGGTFKYGEGYKPTTRLSTALRFAQGKLGPVPSFFVDALAGEDFEHNEFDLTETDPLKNPVTKRLVPLMFNDIVDNINEYGPLGPIISIPGFFGVGQATYQKKPSGRSSSSSKPGIGTSIR